MSVFALTFLVAYLTLLIMAVVSRPFYGLCAYLMAFYLHPPARWWGEDLPDWRWSLTAAVITLLSIAVKNKGRFEGFQFVETKVFLVFGIFVWIQLMWAVNVKVHLQYAEQVINFLVLIFLVQGSVRDEKDLRAFIIIAMIGCSYFGYLGMTRLGGGRLNGIGGPSIESANQMSQHVAAILFAGAYLMLIKHQKIWHYLFLALLMAILVKTIVMAGSRGVYVAIGVTGMLMFVLSPKRTRRQLYLLAGVAILLGSIEFGGALFSRFNSVALDEYGEVVDLSARSRIYIAEAQLVMFKNAFLLGHGHQGTLFLSPTYIPEEYLTSITNSEHGGRASHNFVMSLFVDHGLVGASLYLFIIIRCLMHLPTLARMQVREDQQALQLMLIGLCMGLLCLMIAGMTSDHKNAETAIWFFALIPFYMAKLKERSNVS